MESRDNLWGRVSRYKKQKKVFDVDNLFKSSASKDDPLKKNKGIESKSKRRNMIVKYGSDGKPLVQREKRETTKGKNQAKGDLKLEGKKKDETMREFNTRITKETHLHLAKTSQKETKKSQKRKAFLEERKVKLKEKKRKRRHEEDDEDDEQPTKEQRIYQTAKIKHFDVADAPPDFGPQHANKRSDKDLTDRKRFAKLGFASKITSTTTPAPRQKSDYEKLQFEAMRMRVTAKYDEIRKRRHEKKENL
uniref:Uncharacterized protein n=1 Tax=Mucochytrium quahogii TaxID=96639 RepID=A0A7S2RVT6_9STRA